jgi:hypothetical protein
MRHISSKNSLKLGLCFCVIALFSIACKEKDVLGCTDRTSYNYDKLATIDDGSCAFASDLLVGKYVGTDTTETFFDNQISSRVGKPYSFNMERSSGNVVFFKLPTECTSYFGVRPNSIVILDGADCNADVFVGSIQDSVIRFSYGKPVPTSGSYVKHVVRVVKQR